MVREALMTYGIWWGVTRLIKWVFILGWPSAIIYGCGKLLGCNTDKWSESTQQVIALISLAIAVPVYMIYRRGVNRGEE